jgi:hypothetical protein
MIILQKCPQIDWFLRKAHRRKCLGIDIGYTEPGREDHKVFDMYWVEFSDIEAVFCDQDLMFWQKKKKKRKRAGVGIDPLLGYLLEVWKGDSLL